MGFGYKTAWIAVRSRSTAEVADGLALGDRRPMSYAEGIEAACTSGVFVTHRVSEWHQWARAEGGQVTRVYALADGEVTHFVGEPTPAEVEFGIGLRPSPTDDEDDEWYEELPDEDDVLRISGRWSLDPSTIDYEGIAEPGVFGSLTWASDTQ